MTAEKPFNDERLVSLAQEAATRAYVPYSRFRVGAAVLLDDGRIITGCNVENAAYGSTICAERTAITQAVATRPSPGEDPWERPHIRAVAIVGGSANPCYPCGSCRQVLNEFGCERVILTDGTSSYSIPFSDLLPHSFGPEALATTKE